MLYLHETIDIIGDGQLAYLDAIGERAGHSEQANISRLMGSWRVVGSTNRWPRVINLWELDGWEHWADTLERQFSPGRLDAHLAPWWSQATQWRSGGFDRILEPAVYSPVRSALRARGLRTAVCLQVITRLRPGLRSKYLSALGDTLRPRLEARGLVLMGAYAVPMRSDEAVTLWAAPDFRMLCSMYANRHTDAELQRWNDIVTPMRRHSEATWLVPSTHCFFYPGNP